MLDKILPLALSLTMLPVVAVASPAGASPETIRPVSGEPVVIAQAAAIRVFARGDVLPEAYRAKVVKNPYHQGLKPPARGEQWVQVGRTFYLIERETGKVVDRVEL